MKRAYVIAALKFCKLSGWFYIVLDVTSLNFILNFQLGGCVFSSYGVKLVIDPRWELAKAIDLVSRFVCKLGYVFEIPFKVFPLISYIYFSLRKNVWNTIEGTVLNQDLNYLILQSRHFVQKYLLWVKFYNLTKGRAGASKYE